MTPLKEVLRYSLPQVGDRVVISGRELSDKFKIGDVCKVVSRGDKSVVLSTPNDGFQRCKIYQLRPLRDKVDEAQNKLFVYGIFLDEHSRVFYGMKNPKYATVEGYATLGGTIVKAVKNEKYTLTGLLVDMDPTKWSRLDELEAGYDRVEIKTTLGVTAWMYVEKGE